MCIRISLVVRVLSWYTKGWINLGSILARGFLSFSHFCHFFWNMQMIWSKKSQNLMGGERPLGEVTHKIWRFSHSWFLRKTSNRVITYSTITAVEEKMTDKPTHWWFVYWSQKTQHFLRIFSFMLFTKKVPKFRGGTPLKSCFFCSSIRPSSLYFFTS